MKLKKKEEEEEAEELRENEYKWHSFHREDSCALRTLVCLLSRFLSFFLPFSLVSLHRTALRSYQFLVSAASVAVCDDKNYRRTYCHSVQWTFLLLSSLVLFHSIVLECRMRLYRMVKDIVREGQIDTRCRNNWSASEMQSMRSWSLSSSSSSSGSFFLEFRSIIFQSPFWSDLCFFRRYNVVVLMCSGPAMLLTLVPHFLRILLSLFIPKLLRLPSGVENRHKTYNI